MCAGYKIKMINVLEYLFKLYIFFYYKEVLRNSIYFTWSFLFDFSNL